MVHATLTRPPCRVCLALLIAALTAGCSQVYKVKVDSIRTPEVAPRRSYHLVASDHGLGVPDPLTERARESVARALDASGLFAASTVEWADIIIVYDVTISPTRMIAQADPTSPTAAATHVFTPDEPNGTIADCSGTMAPSASVKRVVAMREKRLALVAYESTHDNGTSAPLGAQLWRVDVAIQDSSRSAEPLLPVLAAALVGCVDRTTDRSTIRLVSARAQVPTPSSRTN